MGEPIPLTILVSGQDRREDSRYFEGHDPNDAAESQSPLTDVSFASSPTMTEQGNAYDLEDNRRSFPSAKTDISQPTDMDQDSNIVTWDGPNDPANPMNWSEGLKWGNVAVIAAITFIT